MSGSHSVSIIAERGPGESTWGYRYILIGTNHYVIGTNHYVDAKLPTAYDALRAGVEAFAGWAVTAAIGAADE